MTFDDSFTKPGSVPFKWEIRPGVPKIQYRQQKLKHTPQPPPSPSPAAAAAVEVDDRRSSSSVPPQKLKPPPGGFQFFQPIEPRSQSFRSAPRIRSDRFSPGCFPAPTLRQKGSKWRVFVPRPDSKHGYSSELETLARWSISSRRSLSPFTASPASSSFSSFKSSPRPILDSEWAGFGLF